MIDEILEFWFGDSLEKDPLKNAALWFKKDPNFDMDISEKFKDLLPQAQEGKLDDWKKTPQGSLAFIILTDQFPRNIFRNQKTSFAFDPLALKTSKDGIEHKLDKSLHWVERVFYYMPFMHSEDLKTQEQSLLLYQNLLRETPKPFKDSVENNYDYAMKHYEIIHRFNRFPHRNLILKRESTPEEIEFLKQPGSSF
ncbi:MAG: DUF924 family protein [Bdellovibrionota bacterium]